MKTVSKKVYSGLLATYFAILFLLSPISVLSVGNDSIAEIEKVYCNATIEDDFLEKQVCVIIHPDWYEKTYTVDDFSEINCFSVEFTATGKVGDQLVQLLLVRFQDGGKQKVLDVVQQLESRSDIYAADPNYLIEICDSNEEILINEADIVQPLTQTDASTSVCIPNDPLFADQWGLQRLSLPQAWTIETGSPTVLVGVIDGGIQGNHPDLQNRVNEELSRTFLEGAGDPLVDAYGHGTRMAGVIGAEANNQIGISGVCWNVQLVSLKVAGGNGILNTASACEAIQYAEDHGITILNYSAGSYTSNAQLAAAIQNYSGLFICSAGNDGMNTDTTPFYPAWHNLSNILVVGACKAGGLRADLSNYGQQTVDVFAPGDSIISTTNSGSYSVTVGVSTSLATAYVSGVAALLLSADPTMTTAEIKNAIMAHVDIVNISGTSVFENYCVSGGIVNAYKALHHSTWIYTAGESLYTHTAKCLDCRYSCSQTHTWVDKGSYYLCSLCRMRTTTIPINPSATVIFDLADGEAIAMDSNTMLCFVDGQYFLVKAKTEEEAILTIINQEVII